jgi:hypothetical protein
MCCVRFSAGTSFILNEVLISLLHAIAAKVLHSIYDSFIPNPFQFIIHQSSYQSNSMKTYGGVEV